MHPYTSISFVLYSNIFTGSSFHGHVGMVKKISLWKFAAHVHVYVVIGMSLSEPHTSEPALQDACVHARPTLARLHCKTHVYVCLWMAMYWNFKLNVLMCTFQICTRAEVKRKCLLFCYLTQHRWIYWMWLRTMTDKARLLTDGTIKSRTVVEFTSGKGHA